MFERIQGRRIDYEYIGDRVRPTPRPTMVFLHEGLGSIAMWKDFPQRCAAAAGCDALIYSRYGYGQSDPIDKPRDARYMHDEALLALPELLGKLEIERPILFGHSDGASIALIHAAAFPVRGVAVLAPHLFVEEIALEGIRGIRASYESGDLRQKLARYHANPDSAFWGWHDIWLHDDFRAWDISDSVSRISAPVFAIQGNHDEYGTMQHLDGIARLAPHTRLFKLDNCRHSPHRDQPGAVIDAARELCNVTN